MANINEILARAAALRDETALNSISPERAGSIMYDTLIALNELWLQQGAALVISKIYASVAAMEADTAPVSDLSGKPLRPGQIVVIASSDSDNGSVYRYNGTESPNWSLVGSIGNLDPVDSLDSDSTTLPLAAHQGKVLDGKISQLGQDLHNLDVDVKGGQYLYPYFGKNSGNTSVYLADIGHTFGDRIDFYYNGDLSELVIYYATESALGDILQITDDGNGRGHFTMPNQDNIPRFVIVSTTSSFPTGTTITFFSNTVSGLQNTVSGLQNTVSGLQNTVSGLQFESILIEGNYSAINGGKRMLKYVGGATIRVPLSALGKGTSEQLDFYYNGDLAELVIYSATESGSFSQLLPITDDGNYKAHITTPSSDALTKIAIVSNSNSFPAGTTIIFVCSDDVGIFAKIETLNEDLRNEHRDMLLLKPISNINAQINYNYAISDNGELVGYNGRATTQLIEYNGGAELAMSNKMYAVAFYDENFAIIGNVEYRSTFPTDVPDGTKYFRIGFIWNGEDAIIVKYTIVVTKDGIKTINNQSLLGSGNISVQEQLISGQTIKTVNGLSLLGSGNINISGGGSSDGNFIDACNFGFSTENTPDENVAALQSVVDGGNKTIYVTIPGIYQLNATILLDDNTELIFSKGVIIKKISKEGYANVFRNRGANSRTYNENIIIRGLSIDANFVDTVNGLGHPCFGLRGHLGFVSIKNLQIYNYTIKNLGIGNYGLQVNDCYKFILDGFNISGHKDGIHISSIDGFVIRNGVLKTSDDGIALNAGDWVGSNCVNGPIRNGYIENVIDEDYGEAQLGNFIRLHNGAWCDWQSGMIIQRGDYVVSNGNLYKADCPFNETTPYQFRSTHQPTYDSYVGVQDFGETDIDGNVPTEHLRWILVLKNATYKTADIQDVVIKNLVANSARRFVVTSGDGKGGVYSRCIYVENDAQSPVLPYSQYPNDIVTFENCSVKSSAEIVSCSNIVKFSLKFNGITNVEKMFNIGNINENLPSLLMLNDVDFNGNVQNYDILTGDNIRVIAKNIIKQTPVVISIGGSLVSDTPVSNYPITPRAGDVIIKGSTIKIYDGTQWN